MEKGVDCKQLAWVHEEDGSSNSEKDLDQMLKYVSSKMAGLRLLGHNKCSTSFNMSDRVLVRQNEVAAPPHTT